MTITSASLHYTTVAAEAAKHGITEEALLFGLAYFISLHPKTRAQYADVPPAQRHIAIMQFGGDLYESFLKTEGKEKAAEVTLYMGRTFQPLLEKPVLDGHFVKGMLKMMEDVDRKALTQPRPAGETIKGLYFTLDYLQPVLGAEKVEKALTYARKNFDI